MNLPYSRIHSRIVVPFTALVVVGDRRWWAGIAWVLALSVYVVAIGGDAFGQWRFLVPCLPVLAALSLRGVLHAFTVSRWAGAALALTVPEPPQRGTARFQTVREALQSGPMMFGQIMAALGSDDGREIVLHLDDLRREGVLTRLDEGEYALTDG